MSETYSYEVAQGHGLPHDPFKAIVAPRPIGWISTRDAEGRGNLAPYSFFNAISDTPPVLAFGSSGYKDSVRNAETTGAFVYNLATEALADAMNGSSANFASGEDELRAMGLTPAACRCVDVDRVAESPAALECRVLDVIRLKDLRGDVTDSYVVFGQVVAVHLDMAFLRDGLFDTAAAGSIQRAGYMTDYAVVGPDSMRALRRPGSPEEAIAKYRRRK
ncbi:flavin reductase family protein [Oleiagrimonas sp. MCCC 1A03011]|uniref:flavin reductase family protein n=1 Tax=Oleiagrimonas sp. MCCC 1A03011 TaxID=1926883 RepID=UPI000DC501FD|nr:flavin reductase family protein [Oleiagrimonas sp. MCCC 1A03011]RAP56116.1 Asp/Glu/hydantoin racemase [Oleiagrimonas sp. MCCC 1A03011]